MTENRDTNTTKIKSSQPNWGALVRRRKIIADLDAMRGTKKKTDWQFGAVTILKGYYTQADKELRAYFLKNRRSGLQVARGYALVCDQLVRSLYDFATQHLHPNPNPTDAERLSIIATGGYGRGELAPFSDLDLLFLVPSRPSGWVETIIEVMLYSLWDMGFKLGHAVRTINEAISLARKDVTIHTSLLENRYIWGDKPLAQELAKRFQTEIITGDTGFIQAKLDERDNRHTRFGDTRYSVEPNLKDGKGGLRDLQTVWWLLKHLSRSDDRNEILRMGLLSQKEYRQFCTAEDFLWSVRLALHYIAGRAEERLTFPNQQQLAKSFGYRDSEGALAVERFMKHYFMIAKQVGDLTRVSCAVLEEREQKETLMSRIRWRPRMKGFRLTHNRLSLVDSDDFNKEPPRILELFALMCENELDVHPDCVRSIQSNLRLIDDKLRADKTANKHFLRALTGGVACESTLRRMNEAGVFGRFIPDFGRVVAQMQYDMYHHYTVDEHTIRAIGLLARIEAGGLAGEHPLASLIIHNILSRRVLYVAVLLHDIAKGRGGDHSEVGAEIALELCPRLGLTEAETETVAWLVRWHLLMSATAFKRDLADPKTIEDFCATVKSPERLRLLLVLTVVDIRAVGPNVWNGWKGQLLRDLYFLAEERLVAGHVTQGRSERANKVKEETKQILGFSDKKFDHILGRLHDAYWIAEDQETLLSNAHLMATTDTSEIGVQIRHDTILSATRIEILAPDRMGLFADLAGTLTALGLVIHGAKIHTTKDGAAMDNFTVQNHDGEPILDMQQQLEIHAAITKAAKGSPPKRDTITTANHYDNRHKAFKVVPDVLIDNKASTRATVIEVNAKDRPGLMYDLAHALYRLKLNLVSAHIATYGERAVDVFYVQNMDGEKADHPRRLNNIKSKLLAAAEGQIEPTEQTDTPDQESTRSTA